MPFPVPWPGGCGGRSGRATSALGPSGLLISLRAMSTLATTAPDVSATSARAAERVLVIGGAGCTGPAEATFTTPAFTWTVLTLTGFIGSDEPGMMDSGALAITPLVSGAGSILASLGFG